MLELIQSLSTGDIALAMVLIVAGGQYGIQFLRWQSKVQDTEQKKLDVESQADQQEAQRWNKALDIIAGNTNAIRDSLDNILNATQRIEPITLRIDQRTENIDQKLNQSVVVAMANIAEQLSALARTLEMQSRVIIHTNKLAKQNQHNFKLLVRHMRGDKTE